MSMSGKSKWRKAVARWGKALFSLAAFAAFAQAQNYSCPASPASGAGPDFHGQTLMNSNFAHRNLRNANFANATLVAPFFTGADLTGANFTGATFRGDQSNPLASPNFLFATLDTACFIKASFEAPADFTGATLTCADFSQVDLTAGGGNVIFGEDPLSIDKSRCRPAFRSATMTCEFMKEWQYLDLSGANVSACLSQLTKLDFSNAKMPSVNFSSGVLDGAIFAGAELTQAEFSQASLKGANLSKAILYGAKLNGANLDGANMAGAILTKGPGNSNIPVANLQGAFLRNVNLSQSQISGANFTSASFYGLTAAGTGMCTPDPNTGFTPGCATAAGATMDSTNFSDAYLFGVDFTHATAKGVGFGNSFLAGANFDRARLSADASSGVNTGFTGAFLEGANLQGAILENGISLQDAFVDFRPSGNTIYLVLSGNHTTFSGYWNSVGAPVCAQMVYDNPTTVPTTDSTTTCPNHLQYPGGCDAPDPDGSNGNWKGLVDISQWASYEYDSTYTKAPAGGAPAKCTPDVLWNYNKIP
jgi:uncharacterized protein YjbI with pentapeptide repeats